MDETNQNAINANRDSNPDAITGAPGSHPVSTGIGAAAAGAAGAAIGSIVPGVGTLIGGAVGAIAGALGGGYAGKAVGEAIDPTGTDEYWRANHKAEPLDDGGSSYDRYRPAYQYGAQLADTTESTKFDESAVRKAWNSDSASAGLNIDAAMPAIRDEFNRKIQLREERLNVSKERVSTGEVGIRKEVTTERKTIEVPVEREELVITRTAGSGVATKGTIQDEEIRIPLSEEKVNVSKDTVVTGEVELSKRKVQATQTVSEDLRKEDVRVDKTGNARVDDQTKKI